MFIMTKLQFWGVLFFFVPTYRTHTETISELVKDISYNNLFLARPGPCKLKEQSVHQISLDL